MFEGILGFYPQAYSRFINILLILLVLFYFIPLLKKDKTFSNVAYYLLGAFFFHFGYLFTFIINDPMGRLGTCLAIMAPFGMAFMLQFAYDFPVKSFQREKRIVFVVSMVLCAIATAEYWFGVFTSEFRLSQTGYVSHYISKLGPPVSVAIHFMTLLVLYRQSRLVKKNYDKELDYRGPLNFANLVLIEFFTSLIVYAYLYFIQPTFFIHSLINLTTFVVLAGYTIILLKYSRKFISMTRKLIGLLLMISLLCFNLFGFFFMYEKLSAFDQKAENAFKVYMQNKEVIQVMAPEYIYNITEGTYEKDKTAVHEHLNRYLNFEQFRLIQRFIFYGTDQGYVQYQWPYENKGYLVGFKEEAYRAAMHSATLNLVLLLLVFLVLVAALFPMLVNNGILHPVRNLVESIQAITSIENRQPFHGRESEIELLSDSMSFLQSSMRDYQTLQEKYQELQDKSEGSKKTDSPDIHSPAVIEKVKEVKVFIDQNYHYDLSREGLAASVNLSVSSLGKAFKFQHSKTIREYLNSLRIEHSCTKLRETDEPIIMIAYQVGFESLRTFNRAFRKEKSCSPTEYRGSFQDIA